MTNTSSLNKQIAEEAAGWAVALDEAPLRREQKAALLAWLKTSPVHLDEFLMALSLLQGVGVADPEKRTDIDALLRAASADVVPIAASDAGIGGLVEPLCRAQTAPTGRGRRARAPVTKTAAAVAAASLALAVAAGIFLFGPAGMRKNGGEAMIVATALGEQRSVTLDDGSIVYVNTQSRVAVRYTDRYRTVDVERGEALFDVEKDAARPFRVVAGDAVAEAVGTRFNVRYLNETAEISVIEGAVAFERRAGARATPPRLFNGRRAETDRPADARGRGRRGEGDRFILVAGQQADFSPAAAPAVTDADAASVLAWTSRKLIFDGDRLDRVAQEFNRYNRDKLVIGDDALAAMRVSGVFSSDDPDSLVAFLKLTNNLSVVRAGTRIRIEPAAAP